MQSIQPATGELLHEYREHDPQDAARLLERARQAFAAWRGRTLPERSAVLRRAASALRARAESHARLMALEMGKPVTAGRAEVEKCAWVCEHYADHAAGYLAEERIETDASTSVVRCEPLGVLLAVMPWNFPFWQVFRAAAPALMAGNVVALKHASNVPGCALAIEETFREAGLPEGAFTALLVPSSGTAMLIAHPAVAAVTLTGSVEAGRSVASLAGAALKRTVLELGGSDPFVVLADADPEEAAGVACAARTINSGQSCIAAKRFLVERAVLEPFTRSLVERMRALRVGDPLDPATEVGPLAREDLVDELDAQVRDSVAAGATCALGGRRPAGRGAFYPPTVLTGVEPGMRAFDEETFGPLAAVTAARDAAHAIELANASRFGLGASVWTSDPARGATAARAIEAGSVFVNGMVKSDPRLPFGGIKDSGYGRELSREGIREFVNLKTVWVR